MESEGKSVPRYSQITEGIKVRREQGITILIGKLADGDGGIVYQRIIFPELGFFYLKNGGDI